MSNKNKKIDLQEEINKTAKLFDVAKPGDAPAAATSRPVIVGHTAAIKQDPMVKPRPQPTASEPAVKPHQAGGHVPITIEPQKTATPEASAETAPAAPMPESNQAQVVDSLVTEFSTSKQEQKTQSESVQTAEDIEKIIQSKKYFVPIGQESRKRFNMRLLLILVLLIAVLLGFTYAINTGLITV